MKTWHLIYVSHHFLIITNCYLSLAFFKYEIVAQNINLICYHYIFQKNSLEWNLVSKINPNHHLKKFNLLLGKNPKFAMHDHFNFPQLGVWTINLTMGIAQKCINTMVYWCTHLKKKNFIMILSIYDTLKCMM